MRPDRSGDRRENVLQVPERAERKEKRMIISLDMTSEVPIYLQLRNQIIRGMGRGEIGIGEKLPTVRRLAQDAGINTMTVNKAYQMLRQEGIITIDRRHGAAACPAAQEKTETLLQDFGERLELLAAEACLKGISREEFLALCGRTADAVHPRCTEEKATEAETEREEGGPGKWHG